jgi:copper chaperone
MKTTLRSQELSCPSCVEKIEKALKGIKGVSDARVYFNSGRIQIEHDPEQAPSEVLIKAVRAVGYDAKESAF